jgi:hypothetical protein
MTRESPADAVRIHCETGNIGGEKQTRKGKAGAGGGIVTIDNDRALM